MDILNKYKSKLARTLLLFSVFLIILCLCSIALIFTSNPISILLQIRSPSNAALSLSEALRTNDNYEAKQLSDRALWDTIDEWMATNEVRECSDIVTAPISAGPISSSEIKQVSTSFVCVDQTGLVYCFSMKNIIVEETARNRWRVMSWEKIEEGQDC